MDADTGGELGAVHIHGGVGVVQIDLRLGVCLSRSDRSPDGVPLVIWLLEKGRGMLGG